MASKERPFNLSLPCNSTQRNYGKTLSDGILDAGVWKRDDNNGDNAIIAMIIMMSIISIMAKR